METQTALVGSDGHVVLHAVASVDLDFALVVNPSDFEFDDSFGFEKALNDLVLIVFGVLVHEVADGFEDFSDRLVVQRLARVLFFSLFD